MKNGKVRRPMARFFIFVPRPLAALPSFFLASWAEDGPACLFSAGGGAAGFAFAASWAGVRAVGVAVVVETVEAAFAADPESACADDTAADPDSDFTSFSAIAT